MLSWLSLRFSLSPPWRTGWCILSFRRMYKAGTALDEKMLALVSGLLALLVLAVTWMIGPRITN